jgi:hypothetical protein
MKQATSHFYPSSERQKRQNKLKEPSTAFFVRLHYATASGLGAIGEPVVEISQTNNYGAVSVGSGDATASAASNNSLIHQGWSVSPRASAGALQIASSCQGHSVLSKPLEAPRRQFGVPRRILDIAIPG